MKKILYFMPELSLDHTAGSRTRVLSHLRYFKSRGFHVDYFGVKNYFDWETDDIDKMLATGLVDRVFAADRFVPRDQKLKRIFCYKIPEFFKNKFYGIDAYALNNAASFYLCKQFNKVLKENRYDFIIINYSIWANLIRTRKYTGKAHIIIDTNDFITAQSFKSRKKLLDRTFVEEVKRLNYADEVWTVSTDEYYIFSQFLDTHVRLVPNIPLTNSNPDHPEVEKKYDLVYVASANTYNRMSAKWFLDKVYPLLSKDIKICFVGKITEAIDDYPNITKINFVENLDDVYWPSKVVICPMLEGTGIKLKVIEAMANRLPSVCTIRGIDGLPNKINNGCLVSYTPEEFAENIEKLLSDGDLRRKLGEQGHNLYKNYFAPDVRYKQLDSIFGVNHDK